jgi:hypothetical protein
MVGLGEPGGGNSKALAAVVERLLTLRSTRALSRCQVCIGVVGSDAASRTKPALEPQVNCRR